MLKESARKEFEQARYETDPIIIARLLVVGHDCVMQTQQKVRTSRASNENHNSSSFLVQRGRAANEKQNRKHPEQLSLSETCSEVTMQNAQAVACVCEVHYTVTSLKPIYEYQNAGGQYNTPDFIVC